jgi:hypothetical protein
MEQCGGMNELDDTGKGDVPVPFIVTQSGGNKEKSGPYPLTTTGKDVFSNFSDKRHIRVQILLELLLDTFEIFPDKGKGFLHENSSRGKWIK